MRLFGMLVVSFTRLQGLRPMVCWLGGAPAGLALTVLTLVSLVIATQACAQQRAPITPHALITTVPATLVFDGVTVVDVVQGTLVPGQRVVIVGTRIQRMGAPNTVTWPPGAQVVDARQKYLIPGLWDMHFHHDRKPPNLYPLALANGITGLRNAGAQLEHGPILAQSLDSLLKWRREILSGLRVGPPRQILSYMIENNMNEPDDPRRLVDSVKAAGFDMLKFHDLSSPAMYFALAAEARRSGIRFGGHTTPVSVQEASDSGASLIDHGMICGPAVPVTGWMCQESLAQRLWHNDTWFVPTLATIAWVQANILNDSSMFTLATLRILAHYQEQVDSFYSGAMLRGNWLRTSAAAPPPSPATPSRAQGVGLPILAGTDDANMAGLLIHVELATLVAEGLTPVEALQTATLNPARFLHATDSLGTVTPGKLADLVLLDANPLADITNTTTIRAVVANGRYFDRTALDSLVKAAQAQCNEWDACHR